MQTRLSEKYIATAQGSVVDSILRKCVHCGFCNATCPTYQLLGDELDGPRGRIYQMKQYFEGAAANTEMLKHLDRCLTCRSCETTCPSGVKYSHLLEIGREAIEQELPRPLWDRMRRWVIVRFINSGWLFALAIRIGQSLRGFMPAAMRESIPLPQQKITRTTAAHQRKVLLLAGCVQPALAPNTNIKIANLLDRIGIQAIEPGGNFCCGAAALHTSDAELGMHQIKRLIDQWWPYVESGVEAIVVSASGCGVTVRDYARLLADDREYAQKAERISALYCDFIELLETEQLQNPIRARHPQRVAVHTPCTLQHGLGLGNRIEILLQHAGHQICDVGDAHLCCGSAGTYSMLQSKISTQLRDRKIAALSLDRPQVIVTANIGCQLQIAQGNPVPVKHWAELL